MGAKVRKWRAHWYLYERGDDGREIRVHRSRVIGIKKLPVMPALSIADQKLPVWNRWEAQRELARIVANATGGAGVVPGAADSRVAFGWFWRHKWLPLRQATWKPATAAAMTSVLEKRISPRWDAVPLRDITAADLAEWLAQVAQTYSGSMVRRLRLTMNAILEEAIEEDFLTKNPMRRVRLPRLEESERPTLTLEQVRAIAAALPAGRDRLIFLMAVVLGLRPGELFGLRWDDVAPGKLRVDETFGQSGLGTTKTKASKAWVALPQAIADLLSEWRKISTPIAENQWIFPSRGGKQPLRAENWRKRVLAPAAAPLGLGWVTFQVTRRTFATISHDLGINMKSVQAQMRHTTIAMTAGVYTQAIDATQYSALNHIAAEILKKDD